MSVAVLFGPAEMSRETYRRIAEAMKRDGDWPPRGLHYHATFGDSGRLRTYEVWESVHDLEAFGARLRTVFAEHGVNAPTPLVSELVAEEGPSDALT